MGTVWAGIRVNISVKTRVYRLGNGSEASAAKKRINEGKMESTR
jgi:hypothetical protein